METAGYILILFLSLVGMVSIIKAIILCLCKDKRGTEKIILPLDDSFENPETTIRNAVLSNEWTDRNSCHEIYCIYRGKNEESKEICRRVCEDYSNAHYYDINNFKNSVFWGD